MVEVSKSTPQTVLFLYDSGGHIICASTLHPPYENKTIIGTTAWGRLDSTQAAMAQAAMMRCHESKQPQTYDVDVPHIGRWRMTLWPCKAGKVRVIGYSRKIPDEIELLTDRQLEICALLGDGLSSREIAKQLDLARETIDNHRSGISRRLGIRPWQLVAWCGRHREWFC